MYQNFSASSHCKLITQTFHEHKLLFGLKEYIKGPRLLILVVFVTILKINFFILY